MGEEVSFDAMFIYLETHPLVGILLAALAIMFVASLIRMIVRLAVVFALVLVVGLYWTHSEAVSDLDVRTELLKRKVAEYGKGALEVGKVLLKKGANELKKQIEESQQ
tara:strand:+ start:308 stop:631 length:324 start_codon:yes stop_codon:yes gene_type:complete